jgi:hypothetical protein|tara:strand:- start:7573 stop:7731 length:159 start_codon:yes stop_codon:yes gene_type:complete
MEKWGTPYADAMAIPFSRRKRLLREKVRLEKRKAEADRRAAGALRTRSRRRR